MAFTIRLEEAKLHLDAWLAANLAVSQGQSYSIGTRSLTRAHLAEIRKEIAYWKSEVEKMQHGRTGRNRVFRVIPRDL